jgi:colicin import membrane protein
MAERKSDRWISLIQSVLLHAAVVGALAYGFYAYKQSKPVVPTLAIEGTVVGEKDIQPVKPEVTPLPEPPQQPEPPPPEPAPVEDVGPPSPTPEETQQREQEEKQKQQEQQRAEEQRVALEKKQAEDAAAEQQAREEAERKRQQEAEQKRVAEAKKKADEKRKADEAKRKADEEAKVRAASEAELRKSLEAEERLTALRSSNAMVSWVGQIANRIQRAWLKPPSARPGIECVVHVTQVPGGVVTSAKVGECNGDAAVRESIEAAVMRASPLPPPPDPALFERDLDIRFKPQD